MAGDIDVGAFLLAVGVRHHEDRPVERAAGAVLDHYGPRWADKAGPAVGILDGQGRGLHPRHVGAVFDVVDVAGGPQRGLGMGKAIAALWQVSERETGIAIELRGAAA